MGYFSGSDGPAIVAVNNYLLFNVLLNQTSLLEKLMASFNTQKSFMGTDIINKNLITCFCHLFFFEGGGGVGKWRC